MRNIKAIKKCAELFNHVDYDTNVDEFLTKDVRMDDDIREQWIDK